MKTINVVDAKILKAAFRGKKDGLVLIAESHQMIAMDTLFKLPESITERNLAFRVDEIEIADKIKYRYHLSFFGYWASAIEREADFDLRSVIGIEMNEITDQEEIKQHSTASRYT